MKTKSMSIRSSRSGSRTTIMVAAILSLLAFALIVAMQLPGSPVSTPVEATPAVQEEPAGEVATRAMIDYAINLRSASNFTVYGNRGINGLGTTVVRGNSGNAPGGAVGLAARNDLTKSVDAFMQLPCTDLETSNLTGRTLEPGVYCMPSGELLSGNVGFDAKGDASAVFIVRMPGTMQAAEGTTIELLGGATAENVYFVSGDDVTIGNGIDFKANVISRESIVAGTGSNVRGKTLALGEVSLDQNTLGGGTGTLQICKAQTGTTDISNRIFNFTVTGVAGTIAVPVGSCSAPINVPAGSATITELNTGQLIPSGSFTGNFQLVGVDVITPNSTSTLGTVNLAARTAVINVVEGGPAEQLTLRFTNQAAITGYIEICKQRAMNNGTPDPDVSGFFRYTIEGVYTTNTQNPTNRILQEFVAPVGQCTAPIAVTVGNPGNPATVRVSELPRAGYFLESANTFPQNREVGTEVLGSIVDANGNIVAAPGGGYITVVVVAGSTPANETLINFVNRSAGGLVKVCKIAGPGVPVNTLFRFLVRGTGATLPAPPQTNVYGPVERIVDVRAGAPETGGNCAFVPGFGGGVGFAEFQTFVNGTPVRIWELGVSPANTIPQPAGTLLVSRILSTSGFSAGVFNPNPDLEPGTEGETAYIARAAVPARGGVVEVEFVDYRFSPAALKVCKIGGGGLTGSFTFDVTLVSPNSPNGPIFPASTTAVTVSAGPADQGGFCAFVDASNFPGGGLNAGSTVNIVERAVANTSVSAISCPTCLTGGLTVNLGTRTATLSGTGGLRGGDVINSVVFTNVASTPAPASVRAPYDFDGDGKSDPSVFRAETGTWWYAASSQGGQASATTFGISTDRIVPADYDGDGKTDYAVYRNGEWHVLGSTTGYRQVNFGIAGDIPQTGDFDGDGKADMVVYRPSDGTWYMNQSGGTVMSVRFGISTDIPVAADFDGDGRSDPAVYRDGVWYMLRSQAGFGAVQFGIAGDRPVVGDYDGDGKYDQAVYRSGTWHLLRSTDGYLATGFGLSTDVPVEADYDGDGRTDLAVFRPSDGGWHILRSGTELNGYTSIIFGFGTDTPVPAY
ncbi:MAG: ice-binding family protein [Pyrinomonadaceae bacterium]|nr:ice-binding family protein [Pyrinomonadaceae bacterium]